MKVYIVIYAPKAVLPAWIAGADRRLPSAVIMRINTLSLIRVVDMIHKFLSSWNPKQKKM